MSARFPIRPFGSGRWITPGLALGAPRAAMRPPPVDPAVLAAARRILAAGPTPHASTRDMERMASRRTTPRRPER